MNSALNVGVSVGYKTMEQKHIARCNAISKVPRDLFLVVSIFVILFEISTAQTIHYNGLNKDGYVT